jgi:hypothetical protein
MELKDLLEGTKEDNNFPAKLRDDIISYFNGEIDFKKLELGKDSICNSWYLRKYTSALKNPMKISDNEEVLKRVFRIYFYLIGKNQLISKFLRIDFKKIIEIYPELYQEQLDKIEFIEDIIIEFFNKNPQNAKNVLLEKFDKKDILYVLEQDGKLKTNGHYNFTHNLSCLFLIEDIQNSFESKDYVRAKKLSIEYIKRLSKDYFIGTSYIVEGSTKGNEIRKSLSEKETNALLTLVESGKNWEKNIETLENNFFRIEIDNHQRPIYPFFEHDKDFISFFDYIKNIVVNDERLEFVNRIKNILLKMRPNFYISKLYFIYLKNACGWKDAHQSVEELDKLMNENKALKKPLLKHFISYTIEHFSCNFVIHNKVMELIISKYGIDCISSHFNTRSQRDYITGIYLLSKFDKNKELSIIQYSLYNMMLDDLLKNVAKDEISITKLKNYITGISDEIQLNGDFKNNIGTIGTFSEWYIFKGQPLERLVEVCLKSNNKFLIKMLILYFIKCEEEFPHKYLLDLIIKINININSFVKEYIIYAEKFSNNYSGQYKYIFRDNLYDNDIFAMGLKYMEDNNINCVQMSQCLLPQQKKILIESIYSDGKTKHEATSLINFLGEKQKTFLDSLMKILKNLDESVINEVEEKIYSEITKYSKDKEILAVEVLCHYANNREKLEGLYNKVKNPKSRNIIANTLNLSIKNIYKDTNGKFDLDKYLDTVYKKPNKAPIDLDKIIVPRRKDGKDSTRAIEHLILSYKTSNEFTINKEAISIAECFTSDSLNEFAKSIFISWINSKMESKDKWKLLIPIIHGDYETIKEIEKLIEKLTNNSRQKLAIYLIKALGLRGTKEAFLTIEQIRRKTKSKTVRNASIEAFEIASEQLGISKEELGDQLVGDMGFISGYIPLDYGKQNIKLYISKELKFEIENEKGKIYKSLPKAKKDDNDLEIEKAKEKFKIFKKELRDMVNIQKNRLEDAFVEWRLWQWEKWKNLFLGNPVMNILGKSILWGIYNEGKLIKAFTFDTEMFDIDYEEVIITNKDKIGIVHPLELEENELKRWKEIFKENEITIFFEQLDREILEVENENALEFIPKIYPRNNPSTFVQRLRKKGWNIGSIRDSGSFDEIYKEIKSLNIGIEATFSDSLYVGGYGYEVYHSNDGLIGIWKIEFYRLGEFIRESYDYDELENHQGIRYKVSELPKRIVSELLFEIKKALT